MLSSLVLLGTVHGDPSGFRRLDTFLRSYQADCVLLELSPYGLAYRREHQTRLLQGLESNLRVAAEACDLSSRDATRHPQVLAIRRQLSLPFEYKAASLFASLTQTPLSLVDDSSFSRRWIKLWPELICVENLKTLLTADVEMRPAVSTEYAFAARCVLGTSLDPFPAQCEITAPGGKPWKKRERYMAKRVIRALSTHSPRRPLFVGGWRHLTRGGSSPTLRDYLGIHEDQCLLLDRV